MPQGLGRFATTISDTATGEPSVGASVEIRRQGATINGDQEGVSPLTVAVHDVGGIRIGDLVSVGVSSTSIAVDEVDHSIRTIRLTGFIGTLGLTDGDRLTPISGLVPVFTDIATLNTGSNPLTTDSNGSPLSNGLDPAYIVHGSVDYLVSGGDPDITETLFEDFYVGETIPHSDGSCARYGIRVDNITDDGVSLNNALSDIARTLAGGTGGVLELPKGTLQSEVQIVVPAGVTLRGQGTATIIAATEDLDFNTLTEANNALLRLGTGSGAALGARIEDLVLDCVDFPASVAMYTSQASHRSGMSNVTVLRAVKYGIWLTGTDVQGFEIDGLRLGMSDTALFATAKGIYILNTTGQTSIRDFKIGPYSALSPVMLAGIHCAHTNGHAVSIRDGYIQYCTNGIKASTSGVVLSNIVGHGPGSVTNVLLIDNAVGQVSCRMIFVAGATNSIVDTNRSLTMAGDTAFYETGIATDTSSMGFNDSDTLWQVKNPVHWYGAQTFDGAVAMGGAFTPTGDVTISDDLIITGRILRHGWETVASGNTISVAKNLVRLTGSTTIKTINIDGSAPGATHDGYPLSLWTTNGSITVDNTGNISINGGSISLAGGTTATGQGMSLRWSQTDSKWAPVSSKG